VPDDSATFGDGLFGGPLWGGDGTVTPPEPADVVGLYGAISLEYIPSGDVSLQAVPFGAVTIQETPRGSVTW
jgi:hypothetical protein